MSDLRSVLERADHAVSLVPLPVGGLEGLQRRRDRKRRNARITAAVVGLAVFLAAVWFVTSGVPADRGLTPGATGPTRGTTGPTPSSDYPGQVGIVGIAPADAPPSLPARGQLVAHATFTHTDGDPGRFRLYLYADGRVIWEKLGDVLESGAPVGDATGLVEQRLTTEGVELVRSEVLSVGAFTEDVSLVGAYALRYGTVEVRTGDRMVGISWNNGGPMDGTPATQKQIRDLQALDDRLEHLESWLPASAWADAEVRAFVPSRYSFCLETVREVPFDRVLASLPRAAEETILTWDPPFRENSSTGFAPSFLFCSDLTSAQARDLALILDESGVATDGADTFGITYSIAPSHVGDFSVTIFFEADLPDAP